MSWGTGKLHVAIDEPGRRLGLATTEKPVAKLSARMGCLAVILPIVALALWKLLGGNADANLEDVLSQVGIAWFVVIVALFFIRAIVFPPRQVVSIDAERNADIRVAIDLSGREPAKVRTRRTDELVSVDLSVDSGSSGRFETHFPMRFAFGDREGRPWVDRTIEVEGVNRDEEALDLLARLGSVLGLGYYQVVARDPSRLKLRATREAGPDAQRLPHPEESNAYAEDRVEPGISLPDEVRASFDPRRPLPAGLAILQWDPGRRIVIGRRRRNVAAALCAVLAVVSAASVIAAWFPDTSDASRAFIDAAGRWWDQVSNVGIEGGITFMRVAIGIVSAVGLVAAVLIGQRLLDRTVIDLVRRRVLTRMGLRRREIRIPDIQSLWLVKKTSQYRHPAGHGSGSTPHRDYRVEVRTNRDEPLPILRFYTTTNYRKAERMYQRLYPLSAELAQAMGVPHHYEPDAND